MPAMVGLVGRFFGSASLAELIGIVSGISMGMGAMRPYIAGFFCDITGSYTVPFVLAASTLAVGGFLVLTLKPIDTGKAKSPSVESM